MKTKAQLPKGPRLQKPSDIYYGFHISHLFRRAEVYVFDGATKRRMGIDTCTPDRKLNGPERKVVLQKYLCNYGIILD